MVLDNVYELLECPVCTEFMSSPIHQCPNGHTLCSMCITRLKSCCPVCHLKIGSIRCLALEKIAEPLELPKQPMELAYNCPYSRSECSIKGSVTHIVTHLKDDHNIVYFDMSHESVFKHSYAPFREKDNTTGLLCVLSRYGQQFCYQFEHFVLGAVPCYIAFIRFMGEDTQAKRFSYSLEIGGNGRRLTWEGVPRSIRDNPHEVCDSLDGLVIPQNLAKLFSDGNEQEFKVQVRGCIRRK
ncbi:E3 ubiquitin-protein ligase SINAT2-like [Rutidosis leptorrhynchoides]|uniref:E3 ubiquitin-protein ligase SINAT2-like n=1 Tax=Rutidosis leptorrhynchoides TaxID=125765 RepID=UPI003A9A1677